jgi:hypothetical protein
VGFWQEDYSERRERMEGHFTLKIDNIVWKKKK